MSIPDRTTFESAYAGRTPWDIGRPQQPSGIAGERKKPPETEPCWPRSAERRKCKVERLQQQGERPIPPSSLA